MTDDRLIDWLIDHGYDYDADAHDWVHSDGTPFAEREAELVGTPERPTGRVAGASSYLAEEDRRTGTVMEELDSAYDKAKKEIDDAQTLSALEEVQNTLVDELSGDIRGDFFKTIEDDVQKLMEEGLPEAEATELATDFRGVRTKEQREDVVSKIKELPAGKRRKVSIVLGGSDLLVEVFPGEVVITEGISKRPTTVASAAEKRIGVLERRQDDFRGMSADEIKAGKGKSLKSIADFWGFDTKKKEDLQQVRDVLTEKGVEIKKTPTGQERIVK